MEARIFKALLATCALLSVAANSRSPNFAVTAPTEEVAREVAEFAERYRRELAIEWLGQELPNWSKACTVTVRLGQVGAGGVTSFNFERGEVFGWNMTLQGPYDRILDSVLPHEVSHTIFACYFRRPLPRWADEGAATLAEIDSERRRQTTTCRQVLGNRTHIPLKKLLAMKEYPPEMRDVMTLYAEGYSLAELLVQRGGKSLYLKFLNDAHYHGWERSAQQNYGYRGLEEMEKEWHGWIIAGSPEVRPDGQLIAAASPTVKPTTAVKSTVATTTPPGTIIRGQSPVDDPFLEPATIVAASAPSPRREEQAPPPRRTQTSVSDPAGNRVTLGAPENKSWTPAPSAITRAQ